MVPHLQGHLCFWLANFLFYFIARVLAIFHHLENENQQELSALWGILNEIMQLLINAGLDGFYELA